jgi:hypothetical protein
VDLSRVGAAFLRLRPTIHEQMLFQSFEKSPLVDCDIAILNDIS